MIVVFAQKYDTGVETIVTMMLPYAVALFGV